MYVKFPCYLGDPFLRLCPGLPNKSSKQLEMNYLTNRKVVLNIQDAKVQLGFEARCVSESSLLKSWRIRYLQSTRELLFIFFTGDNEFCLFLFLFHGLFLPTYLPKKPSLLMQLLPAQFLPRHEFSTISRVAVTVLHPSCCWLYSFAPTAQFPSFRHVTAA